MIEVLRPGLLTTIQDLGRAGYQDQGVPLGGALDPIALRVANLLVGNPAGAAGLEVTLAGPRLHFRSGGLVALAGATLDARLGGEALPPLRPSRIGAGDTLELGNVRHGCRAYLAVAGGLTVPPVLGSRSTYLLGRFGGLDGRALRSGDRLPVGSTPSAPPARHVAQWGASPEVLPRYGDTIRLLPGAHAAALTESSRRQLFAAEFHLGRDSDRMGCRLEGPELALSRPIELLSEGVVPGTIQLPPGGSPIVLLADGGTTGGYPRIAHVASVDLPLLAQLRPGDSLRFQPISLQEAHRLLVARERMLALLDSAIRMRLGAPLRPH
jgi:antagonist of KipI